MLNWEQDPRRTERAIQMLLRRQFPGLRSLDGAGGDGGRDAQLTTADGRTVFEIKSFGRLNGSRRRQVERSLRSAVESAPDMTRWVLVIPMNMTPIRHRVRSSEEAWFDDDLPRCAPGVKLEWWGLDWLDGQVAENVAVQRFLEGPDSQLLQRAREFDMEKAVLAGGVEDLQTRIATLQRTVDEVSMFWTLDFAVRDGFHETRLRAKDPDAPLLDPITITPTFKFRAGDPDDEALRRRFEDTLAFGGTVSLPAGYVTGVDIEASDETRLLLRQGDPTTSEFTILTTREQLPRPLRCYYQVLSGDNVLLAQFPVYLRERTSGTRGVCLYGADAAGIATFEVGLPRPEQYGGPPPGAEGGEARLDFKLVESFVGYEADLLLPVVQTLAAATEGTRIRFELPGLGHVSSGLIDAPPFPDAETTHTVIEDLHRLGELNGSVLRFPADLTVGQVNELRAVVRQLDGEAVEHEGGLTLSLRPGAVGGFLETLKSAPEAGTAGGFLGTYEDRQLTLGELTVGCGPAAFWAPHPRLTNAAELEALASDGSSGAAPVEAIFEPTDVPFRWLPRGEAEAYFASDARPA